MALNSLFVLMCR